MAIVKSYGSLTPAEEFMAKHLEGLKWSVGQKESEQRDVFYKHEKGIEKVLGAKLIHLFSDMNIAGDLAILVFVFDKNIV